MDKCSVIIVAGGKGTRLKSNINKQFLKLNDIPIISYTINKFHGMDFVGEIIVAIPKDCEEFFIEEVIDKNNFTKLRYVMGGEERGNSVYNCLINVGDFEIVLIHDGVRPFVKKEIIKNVFEEAKKNKAVIVAVALKDTVKKVSKNKTIKTLDRSSLWAVQTPQGFDKEFITNAYEKNIKNIKKFTDDASLIEKEYEVKMIEGDYNNIKITTEEDLLLAEFILKNYDTENILKEENKTNDKNIIIPSKKDEVIVYTDGGCSGNPGPGGYGIVMIYKKSKKEFSQGFKLTTNNRMELLSVIVALEKLKMPCNVIIHSDSKYVVDGISKGWAKKWKKNNWTRGKNEKAANIDLWEKVLLQLEIHNVTLKWVKGHAGDKYNERCDELVKKAMFSDDLLNDDGYNG